MSLLVPPRFQGKEEAIFIWEGTREIEFVDKSK
jgi:hypothetical protein